MAEDDATPATLNLHIYSGDDYTREITIEDGGVAVDISSDSFAADIKSARGASQPAEVSFTTSITDGANGVLEISLTDTQTAGLAASTYYWDFEWTKSGGEVTTLLGGTVSVDEEVTE